MMNVLILKFPYQSLFGGGEWHTLKLVEGLQLKGYRFFLASSCPVLLREFAKRRWPTKRFWAGKEPVSMGALILFPFTLPFVVIALFALLLYYRVAKRVKVVYCMQLTEKILLAPFARMLGMRVIWIEHVTPGRWFRANPLKALYRRCARLVTIVVISDIIKKEYADLGVPADRMVRIYPGVDSAHIKQKQVYWDKPNRLIVGVVARLVQEKGIEFFLQALKIVRDIIPNAQAIVVGDGPEREKLEWLSRQLQLKEHVQWVGYQQDVEQWYSYFDMFVLPSVVRESFGIVLVQAMAAGVPVIGSRLGGIREIIDDGSTGLLAEPGSSQSIADCIMRLYTDKALTQSIVSAAHEKVQQSFSIDSMLRDFSIIFSGKHHGPRD